MVNGWNPSTLREALAIRAQYPVIPYAGGTDLMIAEEREGAYLFLNRIPELKRIVREGNILRMGAGCTFTELLEHSETPALLREALALIAAPAIRNEGTIGGNIANGSAKADSALIFFVADASVRLQSIAGERVLPIREFYLGRKKLDLRPDELITEVLLPLRWLDSYDYQKIGARKALAISRVAFAGLMTVENGIILHCATAYGAVSDVIIRRPDLDAMLIGKAVEQAKALKSQYLAAYAEAIAPTQGRVSATYRKTVCLNLLDNFLKKFGV
ncbi:MAG TPA: FAD binding domain-containing protein [Candidatus Limiplasma sp.]|nr:FAD binding domain-containing protein [Candidatus Limiplasma sp.]HPS81218.1 FAD binding domain-containing protein [Candidatus Limiplasma sp.]